MSERRIIQFLINRRAGFDDTSTSTEVAGASYLSAAAKVHATGRADLWSPTQLSAASRRPSLRGKGSVRGSVVDSANNREIVFESLLERGMAEMLMARTDVRRIADQPPPVSYIDATGRTRKHTFDFLVTTTDGRRCAIAVKPLAKVKRSRIEETVAAIERQVGDRFADTYLIRTNQHITKTRVANARLILRSRRVRNDGDIAAIRSIVGNLPGTFMIADIVSRSKIGARGFAALVALIDDGEVQTIGDGRIDYVTRARFVASPRFASAA